MAKNNERRMKWPWVKYTLGVGGMGEWGWGGGRKSKQIRKEKWRTEKIGNLVSRRGRQLKSSMK